MTGGVSRISLQSPVFKFTKGVGGVCCIKRQWGVGDFKCGVRVDNAISNAEFVCAEHSVVVPRAPFAPVWGVGVTG